MLDLFYSGILLTLFVIWLACLRPVRFGRVVSFLKAHKKAFSVFLWVVFIGFAIGYLAFFNQLAEMHDIPDAVNSAVKSEENGVNPYVANVVPRFESKYSANPSWTFGTYNYLSLDLVAYEAFHFVMSPLGMPVWFVVTNLLLSAVAFILLREVLKVQWKYYLPFAGTVMLFYSFDNASLTLMLISLSAYLLHKSKMNHESTATIAMGLAVMTKVYAIIPFAVLVAYLLQQRARARNWHMFARVSASVGVSGVVGVALMIPFGIWEVLRAAVLFNTSAAARIGTASGGTLLAEIPMSSGMYTAVSIALVVGAMVAALKLSSLNDRMMLVSFVFLAVVVKSSLAPLIVPGVYLGLKLKEVSLRRTMQAQESSDIQHAVREESRGSPSRRQTRA